MVNGRLPKRWKWNPWNTLIKTADQKSPTPPRHFKTQVPQGRGRGVDLVALLAIYNSFLIVFWILNVKDEVVVLIRYSQLFLSFREEPYLIMHSNPICMLVGKHHRLLHALRAYFFLMNFRTNSYLSKSTFILNAHYVLISMIISVKTMGKSNPANPERNTNFLKFWNNHKEPPKSCEHEWVMTGESQPANYARKIWKICFKRRNDYRGLNWNRVWKIIGWAEKE